MLQEVVVVKDCGVRLALLAQSPFTIRTVLDFIVYLRGEYQPFENRVFVLCRTDRGLTHFLCLTDGLSLGGLRSVFQCCLLLDAISFILIYNHENEQYSGEQLELTRVISDVERLLGVFLEDSYWITLFSMKRIEV